MPQKVLILEDDIATLDLFEKILHLENYKTVKARSAEDAIKILYSTPLDLAIVDRTLPDEDGLEIVKEIKRHASFRYTAVIFVSGRSLTHDKVDAFRLGADDYLSKPFSPEELVGRIKAILNKTSPLIHPLSHLPNAVACNREIAEFDKKNQEHPHIFGIHFTQYEVFKNTFQDKIEQFMEGMGHLLFKEFQTFDMEGFIAHMSDDLLVLLAEKEMGDLFLEQIENQYQSFRKKILRRSPLDYLKKGPEELLEIKFRRITNGPPRGYSIDEIKAELALLKKTYSVNSTAY